MVGRNQKPHDGDGYKRPRRGSTGEPSTARPFCAVVLHQADPRFKIISVDAAGLVVGDEVVDSAHYRCTESTTEPTCQPPASGALTINQLAQHLGVSRRTIDRMVDDGQIPCLTIRSHRRFYLPDVLHALMAGTETTAATPPEIDQRSVDGLPGAPSSHRRGRNEESTRRIPIRVPRDSEPRDTSTPNLRIGRSEPEGTP
jgi:excisionase family DNA binding protein